MLLQRGDIWVKLVTMHMFLSWKDVINGDLSGYSVQMADNVTVQEGLCVTIPCNFTADSRTTFTNSIGIWRDFALNNVSYSNKYRNGTKSNFHVTGNPDNGDCTLTITNAGREDNGSYYFRFEEHVTSQIKYSYSAKPVKVTVKGVFDGNPPKYSVQMADSVTVQEGLCVTIPCNFTADRRTTFTNSSGIWRDFAQNDVAYSNKSRNGIKPNFHVTGNPDNGDCTLTITNAGREDDGFYHFWLEENVTSRAKYSYCTKLVKVTVTDVFNGNPPKYAVQMADSVTVQEGLCVTIPCNFTADSRTTFTNSTVIWRDFAQNDVAYSNKSRKGIKPNFHVTGNPDNGDCTLTITNAGREDDGFYHLWFEENVIPQANNSYCTKLIKVTVTELKEELQILTHGKRIAGEEVNLTCIPPGNCTGTPPTVEWVKSDHSGTWKSSAFVTFIPTKSDHQTNVTCRMTFQAGKKNITKNKKIKLNVKYPPSVTVTTTDNKTVDRYVNVSGQKPVTLICRADSNPEANVTWYKDNNIVQKNKSAAALHIDITSHTIYVCSAWNELGKDLRQVEVFLQGTPSSQSFINETTVRDLFIGVACGITISLIIVLLFKFCSKNKPILKSDLNPPQGSPSSQGFPTDANNQIYAQVQEPNFQAAENPNEPSDSKDVNYASIKFCKVAAKGIPEEPEIEYSEIKFH